MIKLNLKQAVTVSVITVSLLAGGGVAEASGSYDTDNSIVDYLKSIGEDSSFTYREQLASQHEIYDYIGSEDQNVKLLSILRDKETPNTQSVQSVQQTQQSQPVQSTETSKPQGKTLTVEATAYTAYCSGCSGVTATGINLRANPNQKVIAVDPRVIPLGSKVYVEGYGTAIAGDTGGAIKGHRIDIFIPNYAKAMEFGRRTVKITILD